MNVPKMERYIRTRYYCDNCFKTYLEVWDSKLGEVIEGKVPEECEKCNLNTRIHVKVV